MGILWQTELGRNTAIFFLSRLLVAFILFLSSFLLQFLLFSFFRCCPHLLPNSFSYHRLLLLSPPRFYVSLFLIVALHILPYLLFLLSLFPLLFITLAFFNFFVMPPFFPPSLHFILSLFPLLFSFPFPHPNLFFFYCNFLFPTSLRLLSSSFSFLSLHF